MKTIKCKYLYLSLLSLLTMTSCNMNTTVGSGNVITHEIPVDMYNKIELEGSANIVYEAKPDADAYLQIETDDNIVPLVIIRVKDNTLQITTKGNISPTRLVVHTNSPSLAGVESKGSSDIYLKGAIAGQELDIEQKGSGNVSADNLVYEKVEVDIKGSGNMTLKGMTKSASIEISGSGDINATGMVANNTKCDIKGSGSMTINALETLSVDIAGSGSVSYKGNPQITKMEIKGSGSLQALK